MATSATLPAPSAPAPSGTVFDVSDMISMAPKDAFSGLTDDAPVDDAPAPDPPADDAPTVDPPADEPDETVVEDAPAEPAAADATPSPEDLPEGVRKGKDAQGKDRFFLNETRYNAFHGSYKLAREAGELLGEPLSIDGLKLRNDALRLNETLFSNLTSGEPESQAIVVRDILAQMNTARENGEVGVDPTVPFAETVYDNLREHSPDGYASLRLRAARDLVEEMFDEAARAGDEHLFSGAQHFARKVAGIGPKPADMTDAAYIAQVREVCGRMNIPFHAITEMQGLGKEDPVAVLARENAQLKAQINGRSAPANTAEQFQTWHRGNVQDINKAILDDAVKPALASVEAAWKSFPADYDSLVVDRLNREIMKAVNGDAGVNQRAAELKRQAQRATSEPVRQRIGEDLKRLFVNRAKLAAEALAPPILKFAADSLKGRSDATHERRNGAQNRTAPKGTSTPVNRSAVPDNPGFKNGVFDVDTAVRMSAARMK